LYLMGMLPLMQAGAGYYPATQWQASAKGGVSKGTVTSYAINILFRPPKLFPINPPQAAPGATVTIKGENFVRNMKVRFGTIDVPATVSSVYEATATVPTVLTAGDTPIQLLAGDYSSEGYSNRFTVLP
jgi:IPT/TIG domain-containing protein